MLVRICAVLSKICAFNLIAQSYIPDGFLVGDIAPLCGLATPKRVHELLVALMVQLLQPRNRCPVMVVHDQERRAVM